jgi:hypothetical protein
LPDGSRLLAFHEVWVRAEGDLGYKLARRTYRPGRYMLCPTRESRALFGSSRYMPSRAGQQPSSLPKAWQGQPLVCGQSSLSTPNRNSRHRLRPAADPTTAPGGSATTAVVEEAVWWVSPSAQTSTHSTPATSNTIAPATSNTIAPDDARFEMLHRRPSRGEVRRIPHSRTSENANSTYFGE